MGFLLYSLIIEFYWSSLHFWNMKKQSLVYPYIEPKFWNIIFLFKINPMTFFEFNKTSMISMTKFIFWYLNSFLLLLYRCRPFPLHFETDDVKKWCLIIFYNFREQAANNIVWHFNFMMLIFILLAIYLLSIVLCLWFVCHASVILFVTQMFTLHSDDSITCHFSVCILCPNVNISHASILFVFMLSV